MKNTNLILRRNSREIINEIKFLKGLKLEDPKSIITPKDILNIIKEKLLNKSNYTNIVEELNYDYTYFEEININKFIIGQTEISNKLKSIKQILENINISQGFITSTDIFDNHFYPLIADIAKKLLKENHNQDLSNLEKAKYYNWVTNIVLLNYYTLSNQCLKSINKNLKKYAHSDNENTLLNLKAEIMVLSSWSESFLDPSIRQHLKRTRPKIIPEIYVGYDTEYKPEDWGINKLLSAQLSITSGIKIEVPLTRAYTFEGVNTLTSETYLKSEDSLPECMDKELILKIIQNSINYNRLLLFGNHDIIMKELCNYLINEKGSLLDNYNRTEKGIIFQFKKLPIKNKFIKGKEGENLEISWKTLIKIINESSNKELEKNVNKIIDPFKLQGEKTIDLLSDFQPKETASWSGENIPQEKTEDIILSNAENEKLSKSEAFKLPKSKYLKLNNSEIKMSINWRIYFLSHYNAADLSLIQDWNTVKKKNIDIIKGSFVSICKPIKTLGCSVYLRDTICLSSAAARSLDAIGKAHKIPKIEIAQSYKENMEKLLKENPQLFRDYAMTDSIITLIHGLFMNDFSFRLGSLSLPSTLGSISSIYVKKEWKADNYLGYQIHPDYPLGNIQKSINPSGLQALGTTGNYLPMFIGNTMALNSYRGGRNEAIMYGEDRVKIFKDYDFTSCYSTVMSMCGDPDYNNAFYLTNKNIQKLDGDILRQSYIALDLSFKLPSTIKYPPLPVSVGKNLTIYPLEGRTIVTGLEYSTAINILNSELNKIQDSVERKKYFIKINSGICIPFKRESDGSLAYPPFKSVITKLQASRRAHPKKSAMERIYKDLGNMLYGKVVCGISNKRNYDARIEAMKSMTGSDLTNPIIGSWITGFVRSLMAELLYQVQLKGGQVPSCTTDGFVCDIPDLENLLLEKDLNNQAEKALKELTLARLEIEESLNHGERVYFKISDFLKALQTGWTGFIQNKEGVKKRQTIAEYLKINNLKNNIVIGLDVLTDPSNYLKGNISKFESELKEVYGIEKIELKMKELVKEITEYMELSECKDISQLFKKYKKISRKIINKSIEYKQNNPKILPSDIEGPNNYIDGPNNYHFYENGKYKYPLYEKVQRIIPFILDGNNLISYGLNDADLCNFNMIKDSFILIPELSNDEKYKKYGWYVNKTDKYSKWLSNKNPAMIKVQKFFQEIKSIIKYERILFGIINKLLSLFNKLKIKQIKKEISGLNTLPLLNMYRNIRWELSGNPESLEVKTTVKGLIQWTTRGQVSVNNYELAGAEGEKQFPILTIPIAALTGFQKREVETHSELVNLIQNTMKKGNKLKFLQKSLTGALDNYKYNNHVSMICSLRNFRTIFDCKREIILSKNATGMYETKPFLNKEACILHRTLMNKFKTSIYNRYMGNNIIKRSRNIIQESMKYLILSFVNNYNYSTPLSEKINLISILQGYFKNKNPNLYFTFLKNISYSEINKGMVVNKLLKYSKNLDFFNYLKGKFINHPYYESMLLDFSNFCS